MRTRRFARLALAAGIAAAALFVSVGLYDGSGISASTASAEQRLKDMLQKLRGQSCPRASSSRTGALRRPRSTSPRNMPGAWRK